MKKLLFVIVLALFLPLLSVRHAAADSERALTLMVYMCGSNLESGYGSATADIQEMIASGYDSSKTTVLVMTGGSESWRYAFDPDEISISEIGPRGSRIVWRSSAQSMGASDTLTQFLLFGKDNYPAEDYALILWDHGGGPLEGVCWDELFSMDNLSISELSLGISNAHLHKKLKWIGFDACLMSSAEVARAVSPYAEYMIASQETEPANGWNYAFLNGLENDLTGADTGRRIVDCYFDGLAESKDILTMACIDLSKIDELMAEMDAFFSPMVGTMDENAFIKLSGLRLKTTGFGQKVRAAGEDGYDLVDLNDLISQYGDDGGALGSALDEAVVYSRSNEEGACGLSVYHPYSNKKKYLDTWHGNYQSLDFSTGYANYIEAFGRMLTGVQLADWRNLNIVYNGISENGVHELSLQLDEEQKTNFASAQLMILQNSNVSDDAMHPVCVEPVQVGPSGLLSGSFSVRGLYVEDDNGEVLAGPISYLLTEDEEYFVILNRYADYSGSDQAQEPIYVMRYCTIDPETDEIEIVRDYVFDSVSQTYTNRIAFDESEFTEIIFFEFLRTPPQTSGAIPAFSEWASFNGYSGKIIDLPRNWHLRFRTDMDPSNLYAMFQVTDMQQNTFSSTLVPLDNPSQLPLSIEPSEIAFPGGVLRLTGILDTSELSHGIYLSAELENTTDVTMDYSSTSFVLNGSRTTNEALFAFGLAPGESECTNICLADDELFGLNEMSSLECVVSCRENGDYSSEPEEFDVLLDITGASDLSDVAPNTDCPLSEFSSDGVTWQLIALEQQSGGGIKGFLRVQNDTDEAISDDGYVLINGLRCDDMLNISVNAHNDACCYFDMSNMASLSSLDLTLNGTDRFYTLGLTNLLERSGNTEIKSVELHFGYDGIFGNDGITVHFDLTDPIPLANSGAEAPRTVTLLDGTVSAAAETVLVADDGVGIGIWFENDTDNYASLSLADLEIDGIVYNEFDWADAVIIPPHAKAVRCFSLCRWDEFTAGDEVNELSFSFKLPNQASSPAVIHFPEGTAYGASGGTYLSASDLTVDAAEFASSPVIADDTPVISEIPILPEAEAVQPIIVTAPLSEFERPLVKNVSAHIALLDRETVDGVEYLTSRMIVFGTPMEQADDGSWNKQFSGILPYIGGQPLTVVERVQEDGAVIYEAGVSSVWLFHDAEDYTPDSADWINPVSTMTFDFELEISADEINLNNCTIDYFAWGDVFSERTDYYLSEFETAVYEYGVYFGVDRAANTDTLDYYGLAELPLDGTLTPEFVPITEIDGWLGIYYVVEYEDGTRADRIVDLRTGEILESAAPEE